MRLKELGYSNRRIAERLGVDEWTIRNDLKHLPVRETPHPDRGKSRTQSALDRRLQEGADAIRAAELRARAERIRRSQTGSNAAAKGGQMTPLDRRLQEWADAFQSGELPDEPTKRSES